jgi:hypothetical protein
MTISAYWEERRPDASRRTRGSRDTARHPRPVVQQARLGERREVDLDATRT